MDSSERDEAPSSFLWDESERIRNNDYPNIIKDTCRSLGIPEVRWDGHWYCMGILITDRSHLPILEDPLNFPGGWLGEQNYLNVMLKKNDVLVSRLSSDF
jgi:hypothetical protein